MYLEDKIRPDVRKTIYDFPYILSDFLDKTIILQVVEVAIFC